jgi:hypothetical protein
MNHRTPLSQPYRIGPALPGKRLTILLLILLLPIAGRSDDLHALWDDRCIDCHGHAGDFARNFLSELNGELIGPHHHGEELRAFLRNHYAPDELVEPLYAMLLSQATTPPVYRMHCAGCHGSAAALVREHLELRDGVPYGRAGQRPLDDFLRGHGGLDDDERLVVVDRLRRLAGEVVLIGSD